MKDEIAMRIMFVLPSLQAGGAERVTTILANQFAVEGHEIWIECTSTEKNVSYDMVPEVVIERLELCGLRSPATISKSICYIRRRVQEHAPDVVVSFFNATCVLCALACKPLHIPVVFSERNDPRKLLKGFKNQLYQFLLIHMVKYSVFQTQGAMKLYPAFFTRNAAVILNPLDVEGMPSRYIGERQKKIVTVGRLFEQKRHDVLINAFAQLPEEYSDYILEIYGKGPMKEAIGRQISYLGLEKRVFLMGEHKNVFDCINNAALFVMTSDYEGLPNALLEAMALGLPCISTKCSPGGAEQLIMHRQNGLLVPCDDVEALLEAMKSILSDVSYANELGMAAVQIRVKASKQSIARQWLDYLEEILK